MSAYPEFLTTVSVEARLSAILWSCCLYQLSLAALLTSSLLLGFVLLHLLLAPFRDEAHYVTICSGFQAGEWDSWTQMFSYFSPLSPWTQMNSSSTLDVLFMYLSSYFFLCLEVHLGTFKDSLVSLIKLTSNSSLFCSSVEKGSWFFLPFESSHFSLEQN